MFEAINHQRRRFLGTAAMTIAAARFGMIESAAAQTGTVKPASVPAIKPGTNTSFASVKQVDAGVLNVGYAEAGPADGPAVILLHGWPYDIHSYVDVAPLLHRRAGEVIVPCAWLCTMLFQVQRLNAQQSAAFCARYDRHDGFAQDREGDLWRL